MQFDGAEMQAGKVAVWVPATNEGFDDPPGLEQYVRTRLGVLVDIREDAQILNGTGLPGYSGILQDPLIQTQGAAASKAKTITAAIRKVEAEEARATAVAINPTDYWDVFDTDPQFWEFLGAGGADACDRSEHGARGRLHFRHRASRPHTRRRRPSHRLARRLLREEQAPDRG